MALEARELLAEKGVDARVVSMPSWEIFDAQDQDYKDSVLPPAVEARVSVESGITSGWERYVGFGGTSVGINRFGASAPGEKVLEELGITPENVANTTLELLGSSERVDEDPGTPAVEDTAPEEGHSVSSFRDRPTWVQTKRWKPSLRGRSRGERTLTEDERDRPGAVGDEISRDDTQEGGLQDQVDEGIVGVTSNPTIFQKAIANSDLYDEQLEELANEFDDPKEIFLRVAQKDIQDACDILKPVYDRTDGKDGYVSLEVSPNLAYDTLATVEEAERLVEMVDRPNLFVKIPATLPGLAAIEEMIARGASINVTLIFSLQRYRAVTDAYIRGLERLVADGGTPWGRERGQLLCLSC